MDNFQAAINYTFPNEGELSNDAHDKGGMTKYGIIKADLKEWNDDIADGRVARPEGFPLYFKVVDQSIKDLTQAQALIIYRWLYWDKIRLNLIADPNLATCIFDICVVRGRGTGVLTAQRSFNTVKGFKMLSVDGKLGQLTANAINNLNDSDKKKFIQAYYQDVSAQFKKIWMLNWTQAKFAKGWENRAKRLLTLAK